MLNRVQQIDLIIQITIKIQLILHTNTAFMTLDNKQEK